ncbi:hypothetical protein E9529_12020 [Blastococcus sp. KM273128]|uniref:hypothetical protein n=1 Tax=Blastococcus sp. KM273128 TaxID=2570314 RepID=UPI001F2CB207|nr:hypothetical protein [Blastococcus sp. KM273128]MCF6744993.1 hypothetical protein [Blastococcus sp. KM273128]
MTTLTEEPAARNYRTRPGRTLRRWLSAAALGLAMAGALHIAAAVDHVPAGELAVGFFLLTAAAQLGLAAWLVVRSWAGSPPDHRLVILGLLGTVALLGLYLVSYTTDLLDAFAVTDGTGAGGHSSSSSGHGGTAPGFSGVDPATGVDLSTGVVRSDGPVAMAGEPVDAGHGPGALGTATVAAELLTLAALTALLPRTWRGRATNALLGVGVLTWGLWFTGVLA